MRMLSLLLFLASACLTVMWALGYAWISVMACAFRGPGGSGQACEIPMPWALNSSDFSGMVLMPAVVVLVVFALGVLAHRAANAAQDQEAASEEPGSM